MFPVDRKYGDCSKALRNPQKVDLCVLASFSCGVYAETQGETQGRKVLPVAGFRRSVSRLKHLFKDSSPLWLRAKYAIKLRRDVKHAWWSEHDLWRHVCIMANEGSHLWLPRWTFSVRCFQLFLIWDTASRLCHPFLLFRSSSLSEKRKEGPLERPASTWCLHSRY